MSLKALLAANPAAQAEFDAEIQAAVTKGKAEGQKAMQETAKAVGPFLANAAYPQQVGAMAVKVLTGEQPQSALDALVSMADMVTEMQKGKGGAEGTLKTGETQGQQQVVVDPSSVSDEASLQAAIELGKKGGA